MDTVCNALICLKQMVEIQSSCSACFEMLCALRTVQQSIKSFGAGFSGDQSRASGQRSPLHFVSFFRTARCSSSNPQWTEIECSPIRFCFSITGHWDWIASGCENLCLGNFHSICTHGADICPFLQSHGGGVLCFM